MFPAQKPQRSVPLSETPKRPPARKTGAKSAPTKSALTKTAAAKSAPAKAAPRRKANSGLEAARWTKLILAALEDDKAEDIVSIDIAGKSSIADMLIVASGRSARHVAALADHLMKKLKEAGATYLAVEGLPTADWVLVDAGDVIVHLFRPEVRSFYNIEKIWTPPALVRAANA